MFECESCHLEFDKKATLLRHVSHKKICKEHYGEYRLKDMRIEGELARKRKWWKGHSNEAKQSYQQNKIQIREKEKQKYVKEHVRYETDEGRAFNAFYDFVYDCCKTEAIEKLINTGVAYDKVYKTASNKATDRAVVISYTFYFMRSTFKCYTISSNQTFKSYTISISYQFNFQMLYIHRCYT